jgi:crotonobetaine/carnitine-CoA ligase
MPVVSSDLDIVETLDNLLLRRAAERPDDIFLRFAGGEVSFAEADRRVSAVAGGLAGLGIGRAQLVPVLLPNCAELVVTWLALCRLGAVATLVNTALRGPALRHALELTSARQMVVHSSLTPSLEPVVPELSTLRTAVVVGDHLAASGYLPGFDVVPFTDVEADEAYVPATTTHSVTDPAMVLFTSGTTGPSKGCVLSHRYAVRQAQLMIEHFELRADDVLYSPFPLFHLDASVLTVVPALELGTTAAIAERFSASQFWDDVRRFGATVFDFMGATLTMLYKREPRPDDADNPARLAWGVPVPEFADAFEDRFGLRLVEAYGSTDAGIPIYQPLDQPRRPGSCGRAIAAYDVRLVDGDDVEVRPGEVGELVVRPLEPSLISDGYYGMPEATIESRRNLWFHTGDLASRDTDGYYYFVGRRTDSIRRRGENISCFEVEEVIKLHPQVLDAAAFGVPSELSEEDVMVTLVPRPHQVVDPAELLQFCQRRMARHMLPRYVDITDQLPRTPTEKVEKAVLRARGVTATTWDGQTDHHGPDAAPPIVVTEVADC